jgi:hypothetical protein
MPVWLSKMVSAQHLELQPRHAGLAQQNGFGTAFRTTAYLHRGWQKAQQSLTPAVNWLDSFISPDGLPLLVSHLLQSKFQFHG